MNKDPTIVALLERLDLSERGWIAVDHWDSDLMAIGIARPNEPRRLIYVSTFGKPNERFYFECEEPEGSDETEFRTGKSSEEATFDELLSAAVQHLDGASDEQAPVPAAGAD
jgi:hypothetical protein